MKPAARSLLLSAGLLLAACGPPDDGVDAPVEEVDEQTVFDPLVDSLKDAERVETLTEQQKRQMDDALRRMEGGEDEPER